MAALIRDVYQHTRDVKIRFSEGDWVTGARDTFIGWHGIVQGIKRKWEPSELLHSPAELKRMIKADDNRLYLATPLVLVHWMERAYCPRSQDHWAKIRGHPIIGCRQERLMLQSELSEPLLPFVPHADWDKH